MRRRRSVTNPLRVALLVAAYGCPGGEASTPEMVVYQSPTCGCCGAWVEHIRESGIAVRVEMRNDFSSVRRELGVPWTAAGCHVGVIEGYAVEGHVPSDVVHRLLRERPAIAGITVPGMPAGPPGMERLDGYREPFAV